MAQFYGEIQYFLDVFSIPVCAKGLRFRRDSGNPDISSGIPDTHVPFWRNRPDNWGVEAKAQPALIDQFGELDRRIMEFRPTVERHKRLKEEIAGWYERQAAADSFVADGARFSVQVGPRANKRTIIAMAKLFVRLGKALFLQQCTFPLAELDGLIPESEQGLYVSEERTGARPVKAVARAAPAAARKAA